MTGSRTADQDAQVCAGVGVSLQAYEAQSRKACLRNISIRLQKY